MLCDIKPFYEIEYGAAYLGDAKEILADKSLEGTVDLIMTSPPLHCAVKRSMEMWKQRNMLPGFSILLVFFTGFLNRKAVW